MVHFEWNKKLKMFYDLHLARVFFDFCFSLFFVDAFFVYAGLYLKASVIFIFKTKLGVSLTKKLHSRL